MLEDANFLCEIGCEEIPAGYIPGAIEQIRTVLKKTLADKRIDFDAIEVYATPRRFAILISQLSDFQREDVVEVKGPSVKAAYDADGNPTRALQGFMKGNELELADLIKKETEKGEYVFANKILSAEQTEIIIPEIISQIVNTLVFPKRMKWSDKNVTFPRPITYFVMLYNDKLVPFEVDGISSGTKTRGHFVQNNTMIEISKISEYEDLLKKHSVLLNHIERKEYIRQELLAAAKDAGGCLKEDEELLDIVTFLVENPYVVVCEFNKDFLEVPDIVLIAEMKEHQKYFAVVNEDDSLTNKFLVISNNPATEHIKVGNERVVAARFNDAQFFYAEDKKRKLIDRVDSLKNVLFHKELGSIFDKISRMKKIGEIIADLLGLEKDIIEKTERAIMLCKTDLETAMVYEFTSLQGQIGKLYAMNDGEDPLVAAAIENHYKPKFQGDALPEDIISIIVSLAEKLDNVFSSFSVGNIPKGSQDPYALRRQSNAVIEMLLKNEINLDLKKVLNKVAVNYKDGVVYVDQIVDFIKARAKTIFTDSGFSHDEIEACLSIDNVDFVELFRRARSIHEFRKNENFSQMLVSFKRMNNIVSAFRKDNADYNLVFNMSLLACEEEKQLHAFFDDKKGAIAKYIRESKYIELFELLIEGKGIIDSFFDKVLVMDKDLKVRDNRLYLLEDILINFSGLLDFSKIEDK